MSPREANADAVRRFGNRALQADRIRDANVVGWLENARQDVLYSLRRFRRKPGVLLVAVLSLALGIGANTTIFSALESALWKPLPIPEPERLVTFVVTRNQGPEETDLPAPLALQLRESGIFAGVTTTSSDGLSFSDGGPAERIIGEFVSPDYFNVVGVQPMLGHGFSQQWAAEAVLSYRFWQSHFAGDPSVIGRTIRLNTYPFTIVGVSPPSFSGFVRGSDYELRIPFLPPGRELREIMAISGKPDHWVDTMARLRRGETAASAEAAGDAQLQAFLRATPVEEFQQAGLLHLRVVPGGRGNFERTQQFQQPLYILLALVVVVLFIACANVASMLLAQSISRTQEVAVRASIGAGNGRLARQFLTESVLIAALGGCAALIVAYGAAPLLLRFIPQGHVTISLDLQPDWRVLLLTLFLSAMSGALIGIAPAIQAARANLAVLLKTSSGGSHGDRRAASVRKTLVVCQVAFSVILLIASAAFRHTLADMRPKDFRADAESVLLFTMKPQQEIYTDDHKRRLAAAILEKVKQIRGVRSAALAEYGPLASRTGQTVVFLSGHDPLRADFDAVTPKFFDTVGLRLVAGRDFTDQDRLGSPPVMIINRALQRILYPGESPVGRHLKIRRGQFAGDYEIVAIAADTRYYDLHKPVQPGAWVALSQFAPYMPTLHVQVGPPEQGIISAAIRREFASLDQGVPVFNIRNLQDRVNDALSGERMIATLSGGFGVLALVLAIIGLYGIIAYSVSWRTREIGIRRALGAKAVSVLWMISREAVFLVGIGTAAGFALTGALSRITMRYVALSAAGTSSDLGMVGPAMLLLILVAVAVPSMRALRIDPLRALRHD